MHFAIYPGFINSMNIMKYVNNHPCRFDFQNTAFWLGATQFLSCLWFTIMNSLILWTRINVYFTIVSYVTIKMISEIGKFYYNCIKGDKNNVLLGVFQEQHRPRIVNYRRDMNGKKKSCNMRFQRLVFKMSRGIFVTCLFYFVPVFYIYYN